MAFKKFGSLLQRIFLAVNGHRHLPGNYTKLLLHYGQFCLQRNIFFPEQFNAFANAAQVSKIFFCIQFIQLKDDSPIFYSMHLHRVGSLAESPCKKIKCFFQLFIFCITGHFDLAPASIFTDHCFQFALIFQPLLQVLPVASIFLSSNSLKKGSRLSQSVTTKSAGTKCG